MQKTLTLYDTTIGKKAVVAVTGAVLYGFVIGHMLGNLQVFLGPATFNAYAAALKGNPPLLWGVAPPPPPPQPPSAVIVTPITSNFCHLLNNVPRKKLVPIIFISLFTLLIQTKSLLRTQGRFSKAGQ